MTMGGPEAPRPRYPTDQVLRETMLYRAREEDLAGLARLGDMMHLYLLEYSAGGLTMRDGLVAVARDVRHLEGYLLETAGTSPDEEGSSGKSLKAAAVILARKLGRIAEWMERELGVTPTQEAERVASDSTDG